MSMFKKVLASVGIGATSIDAIFSKSGYIQGEKANGVIKIKGGKVDQQIDELFMTLFTIGHYESNDNKMKSTEKIKSFSITRNLFIQAGSYQEIPFEIEIPYHTPSSSNNKSPVWVHTGADIPNALDRADRDYLDIKESPKSRIFLDAMRDLGFRMREIEVERDTRRANKFYGSEGISVNYVQEYEWTPSSEFRSKFDEVEALLYDNGRELKVWFTKDKRVRGLKSFMEEAIGLDESTVEIIFKEDDLRDPRHIDNVIRRFLNES